MQDSRLRSPRGKTELVKTAILKHALEQNHLCWRLACAKEMIDQIRRDLNGFSGKPGGRISETQRAVDMPHGGMIVVRSAYNPDVSRGEGLDLSLLDEAVSMNP